MHCCGNNVWSVLPPFVFNTKAHRIPALEIIHCSPTPCVQHTTTQLTLSGTACWATCWVWTKCPVGMDSPAWVSFVFCVAACVTLFIFRTWSNFISFQLSHMVLWLLPQWRTQGSAFLTHAWDKSDRIPSKTMHWRPVNLDSETLWSSLTLLDHKHGKHFWKLSNMLKWISDMSLRIFASP